MWQPISTTIMSFQQQLPNNWDFWWNGKKCGEWTKENVALLGIHIFRAESVLVNFIPLFYWSDQQRSLWSKALGFYQLYTCLHILRWRLEFNKGFWYISVDMGRWCSTAQILRISKDISSICSFYLQFFEEVYLVDMIVVCIKLIGRHMHMRLQLRFCRPFFFNQRLVKDVKYESHIR